VPTSWSANLEVWWEFGSPVGFLGILRAAMGRLLEGTMIIRLWGNGGEMYTTVSW
jgi:hypothetical protein